MILLDENFPFDQRDLLTAWGIRSRVVGHALAYLSALDENLIVILHSLKRPTFFTRDKDFFKRELRHPAYCIAWLDVNPAESALFARRFLKHPHFRTKAGRSGLVVRICHDGVHFWQLHKDPLQHTVWE